MKKLYAYLLVLFIAINVFVFFQTEKFMSETSFYVKNIEPKQVNVSLLNQQNEGKIEDITIIEKYVNSEKLFNELNNQFNLKSKMDTYSFLKFKKMIIDLKKEDYLDEYRSLINFKYDFDSYLITIEFTFYENQESKEILTYINEKINIFINQLNKEQSKNQIEFLTLSLKDNLTELEKIKDKILNFQKKNQTIDPNFNIENYLSTISSLKEELLKKEGELIELKSYLKSDNPKIAKLKTIIQEIKNNIQKIEIKTFKNNKDSENNLEFEFLKKELELTFSVYKELLLKNEQLKIDLLKNSKFIMTIIEPTISEKSFVSEYINIFLKITIFFIFISFILYFIVKIIEDHKE